LSPLWAIEQNLLIDFVTCMHQGGDALLVIKAAKDLDQAASLIAYLGANDADLLGEVWHDLIERSADWKGRALIVLVALQARYPKVDTSALTL
jgi:hypothetical protein